MLAIFSRTKPKSPIGFAESFSLLGIANRIFERNAAATDAHRAQLEAADVEDVEGDHLAFADLAQQIFRGNFAVVQNDGAGGGAADAHLVFFGSDGKSREGSLDEKCGQLFVPSTLAKTVNRSAKPALVIHIFSPFRM